MKIVKKDFKICVHQFFFFAVFVLLFLFDQDAEKNQISWIAYFLLGLMILVESLKKNVIIYFYNDLIPLCLFLIIVWIGVIMTPFSMSESFGIAIRLTILYIFLWLIVNYFSYNKNIDMILSPIFYAGCVLAIYIFLHEGMGRFFQLLLSGKRIGGFLGNVNSIGLNCSFSFSAGLALYFMRKKKRYLLGNVLISIIAFGSGSRKVLVFMVAVLLCFYYSNLKFTTQNKIDYKIKFIGFLLLFVILFIIFNSLGLLGTSVDRLLSSFKILSNVDKTDASTAERLFFIRTGFDIFLKYPILGIGINNSANYLRSIHYANPTYFHNNYIEILASTGIFGFIFYYFFYFKILINLTKRYKIHRDFFSLFCMITILLELVLEIALVSYISKRNILMTAVWFSAATINTEENKIENY